MKNKFLIIGIMAMAVVAVVGVITSQSMKSKNGSTTTNMTSAQDTPASTDSTMQQAKNEVIIQDYTFSPSSIKVKKGTTVTWKNTDIAEHSVEMDKGQPDGGPTESVLFGKNKTYSFTFNTVGTFKYHCTPHPYMKGMIEVTES